MDVCLEVCRSGSRERIGIVGRFKQGHSIRHATGVVLSKRNMTMSRDHVYFLTIQVYKIAVRYGEALPLVIAKPKANRKAGLKRSHIMPPSLWNEKHLARLE